MFPSEMPKSAPEGALVQSNIRMPQWALDAFDALAAKKNEEIGWAKYTRSDVMRDALIAALKQEAAPGPQKARKR